jgi:hypothetical protein
MDHVESNTREQRRQEEENFATDEASTRTIASIVVPLLATLLLTGIVAALLCIPPRPHSLTWADLLILAFFYVLIAAFTHAFTIWTLCKLLREQFKSSIFPLIAATWTSVAWLPLLSLSIQKRSIWAAFVPPVMSAYAAVSIARWSHPIEQEISAPPEDRPALKLFQAPDPRWLMRAILPAILISVTLTAGLGVLLLHHTLLAAALLSIGLFMAIWRSSVKPTHDEASDLVSDPWSQTSIRSVLMLFLLAYIFTADALLPYLLNGGGISNTSMHQRPLPAPARDQASTPPSSFYSGVILLSPNNTPRKIVPPPPSSHLTVGHAFTKPVIIPFNGAYWFFKRPSRRPRPDARIVRGDPTKRQIRSTDYVPLAMEAHQPLGSTIKLNCCSAIRVAIRNADNRLGSISMEVVLSDTEADKLSVLSLGNKVIPSSQGRTVADFNRPPVDETLTFPIPASVRGKSFDQITVVLQPNQGAVAGARIAIQQFELIP